MNKRVTIEMPDEMLRLIEQHAAEAGREPDAYVRELIEQHLEDLHDIAAAEAALGRIERGESRTYTWEEMERELGLRIEFDDTAIKNLKKMGRNEADHIRSFLQTRVKPLSDPRLLGKPLLGARLGHLWRYRVGDYRVICDIQDEKLIVLVVEIGHRSAIYR